ncbi:hypothetical protein BBH56_03555 [Spiribacter roseus]|uniref:hypothetical protein n=1 Tax=Spiribacter roseus TaxID=1855875 RepID=UPI000F713237|nr:hypothetical protein BBH56_03555 [Spiribacter roseus]
MPDRSQQGQSTQQGSILLMAVVVIAGIGAVTAGLLAILQQQTVSLTEAVQMDRGIGVADSYRLALIDGRDSEGSSKDLKSLIDEAKLTDNGSNSYTATVDRADGRWGYRFIYDSSGISTGRDLEKKDNIALSGNETKSYTNVELVNPAVSGKVVILITTETTVIMTNPGLSGTVDLIVEDGAYLELVNPGISGNVRFDIKENANVCIRGNPQISGNVSGLNDTQCSGSGNEVWTFQLAN